MGKTRKENENDNQDGQTEEKGTTKWWGFPKWSRLSAWKKWLTAALVFILTTMASWVLIDIGNRTVGSPTVAIGDLLDTPMDAKFEEGVTKAIFEFKSGYGSDAIETLRELETLVEDTATCALIPYLVGRTFEKLLDTTAAVKAFNRAYKRDSTFCPVRIKLGMHYLDKGLNKLAVQHLKYASTVDSLDAKLHFDLSRAYIGDQKIDEAIVELVRTLRIRRDYPGGQDLLVAAMLSNGA